MKLFGNKRRRPTNTGAARRPTENKAPLSPQQEPEETSRLSAKSKAIVLLVCAVALFVCSLLMCHTLIRNSAKALELPSVQEYQNIQYYPDDNPALAPESSIEIPLELSPPVSVNESDRINILLLTPDERTERTDAILIASINLQTRDFALLSVPRDTYISGNYELPKLYRVFSEADDGAQRGIQALREKIKEMLGFWTDYYFVLDETSLTAMTELVDGVAFDVPASPDYTSLASGTQTLRGAEAIELFRYRDDYTDVETDPPQVQRRFLLALLEKLLSDPERFNDNASAISAATRTDLSAEQLAYLAYLLAGTDFDGVFSRALPGGAVEVDGVEYYQVDPDGALAMLNEHFNPLQKDLRIYDLNFRQKTGASGEGQIDPYGFGSSSSSRDEPVRTEPTESTDEEPESSEEPVETDPPESSEEPVETDPPETETPPTEE